MMLWPLYVSNVATQIAIENISEHPELNGASDISENGIFCHLNHDGYSRDI